MSQLAAVLERRQQPRSQRESPTTSGELLVAALLRDQRRLSAIEEFSAWHDAAGDSARSYSNLIPGRSPQAGEQYAFEVDLDKCSGCKSCVTACHSMNGLGPDESWRSVGLLHGGTESDPTQLTVTSSCHHCLDPACMRGCPVAAYEKDPVTGIVEHLDDQCIGCQYCIFTCPYDVPNFDASRGIVRKCNMCKPRLAVGEAPACVQACPGDAIEIRISSAADVIECSETDSGLPAAPSASHTYATTAYVTKRALPANLLPADYYDVSPQHSHPALVGFLVLSQLSVGMLLIGALMGLTAASAATLLAVGMLGLAFSTLHLGRPQYAFRALLGLRTSWLSREIAAFGIYTAATIALVVGLFVGVPDSWLNILVKVAVVGGLGGVVCSVMVYAVTGRALWRAASTTLRFFATSAMLGACGVALVGSIVGRATASDLPGLPDLMAIAIAATAIQLVVELLPLAHLRQRHQSPLRRSAALLLGPLRHVTAARFAIGALGGLVGPLIVLITGANMETSSALLAGICALCLAGELLARHLFFVAVSTPRMPGGLAR